MSDRRLFYTYDTVAALKLAAALSRQDRALYRAPSEIAADVEAIMRSLESAKRAVREHRSPAAAFARIAKVVRAYNAEAVYGEAFADGLLGLRFSSGRYGLPGAVFIVA
jgi:hypothetical protein